MIHLDQQFGLMKTSRWIELVGGRARAIAPLEGSIDIPSRRLAAIPVNHFAIQRGGFW